MPESLARAMRRPQASFHKMSVPLYFLYILYCVRVFSSGFQMHLAKPADSKELVAIVESLARQAQGAGG
jgi:hypothetical protein